jgi:hypothetical protein
MLTARQLFAPLTGLVRLRVASSNTPRPPVTGWRARVWYDPIRIPISYPATVAGETNRSAAIDGHHVASIVAIGRARGGAGGAG